MNKGIKFSGENAAIVANRPLHGNHHLADKNGRVYLCNCCKRIMLNGKPNYGFSFKGSLKHNLSGKEEAQSLSRGLALIDSIAVACPPLGLLGTLFGLMDIFTALQQPGQTAIASPGRTT